MEETILELIELVRRLAGGLSWENDTAYENDLKDLKEKFLLLSKETNRSCSEEKK